MTEPDQKILDQVRHCLDKANHPNTPEAEREMCIRRADTLMLRHAIDQALLDASKKDERREPISKRFRAYDGQWAYQERFRTILSELARTYRCQAAMHSRGDVTVVGMPDDVNYYEMIWTNIYMGFVSKLFPKWNDNLSFDHNVYNFKVAGYKWPQIRDIARDNNHHVPWPDGGMLIRAYKKHAKMIGDEQQIKTQRHDAYRHSYAEGFTLAVCKRLEELRAESREAAEGSGAELALVDASDRIKSMFYEMFEHLRPMTEEESEALWASIREEREAEAKARREMLEAMTPEERAKFDEKEQAEARKQAKKDEAYWRRQDRERSRTYDGSGIRAGRSSGEQVDLGGHHGVGGSTKGVLG